MDQHPRGVYEPEFTSPGGHPILLAVDSEGRQVARVVVTNPENRGHVLHHLRELLDQLDPVGWKKQKTMERRDELELLH